MNRAYLVRKFFSVTVPNCYTKNSAAVLFQAGSPNDHHNYRQEYFFLLLQKLPLPLTKVAPFLE
jgi:hypothetical protein